MPNGRPGDHPLTDLLVHGMHPFPVEIENLLLQVLAIDPIFPDGQRPYLKQVEWWDRINDWQHGRNIEDGRRDLEALLAELRHPGA